MPRNTAGLKRGGGSGRTPGVPNKVTIEAKALCRGLVTAEYLAGFQKRLMSGKLNPLLESMVWAYGFGKPVERHEIGKAGDFTDATDLELQERLRALLQKLSGGDE